MPPSRPYTVTGNRKIAYPQSRVMKNSFPGNDDDDDDGDNEDYEDNEGNEDNDDDHHLSTFEGHEEFLPS